MTPALAWLAVLIAATGLLRHPASRFRSGAVTAAVACGAVAVTVPGADPGPLVDGLLLGSVALATAGVALPGRGAHRRGPPAARSEGPSMLPAFIRLIRVGIALDVVILAVAIGLTVTQAIAVVLDAGTPQALTIHLLPLVAVWVLVGALRTAIRWRDRPGRVGAGLVGAIGLVVLATQDAAHGWIAPPPEHPLRLVAILVLGTAALALHVPPITGPGDLVDPPDQRPPSRHLLGLAPVCLLPSLVWLVTREAESPSPPTAVFVVAGLSAGLLLLVRAVTTLRATEWIIDHDVPTQVLSLVGMSRVIRARARREDRALGLCLVALDDFKGVNDSLGGARANTVLAMVAHRLSTLLGDRATVGRLGGDRFLALLPDHAQVGQETLDVLAEPFLFDDRAIHLTASVGVAPVPPDADIDVLLGMADIAMQAAKADGKAGVVRYRRELHEQVHAPQRLLRQLRDLLDGAPADRVGRIVVAYQPIVELPSNRIVGCEALARWQHPERRLIMPDLFLPVADQGGLTPRLDALVLDLALGRLACWDAEGLEPISLSVNLGLGSMRDPDLFPRIRALLQTHGVAWDRVCLEITEHSELPDDSVISGSLRALTELGVRLSLDDFGAGYTSLNYLCRYPVDLVKIDRSIVLAEADRDRSPLLEGIVGLAAGMRVDVLAEGIETENQRTRLARIGVGHGQGYLFSRPLEAGSLADVMRRRPAPGPPRPAVRDQPLADLGQ